MAVRPAHAGDPINKGISASDWNALNEMRRRKSNASIIGTTATDDALDGIVTVKNTTGNNLPPGSIVGLDAPFILPDGTSDDAKLMLNFQGVVPTDGTDSTTDYTGRFGILLDGVSGEYGAPLVPARIFDVCWARIYMLAATDKFADIEHNNTTRLKSGSSGAAQILYHYPASASYPQECLGYVRIGNPSFVPMCWYGYLTSGTLTTGSGTVTFGEIVKSSQEPLTYSSGTLTFSVPGIYDVAYGGWADMPTPGAVTAYLGIKLNGTVVRGSALGITQTFLNNTDSNGDTGGPTTWTYHVNLFRSMLVEIEEDDELELIYDLSGGATFPHSASSGPGVATQRTTSLSIKRVADRSI